MQPESPTEDKKVVQDQVIHDPVSSPPSVSVQPPLAQPLSKHPSTILDSFGFVFMFITLYFTSASIGMILHTHAEKLFPLIGNEGSESRGLPDVFSWLILDGIGSSYGVISPIIPYLATLIVVYPIFAVLFLLVNKRTLNDPTLRHLKARRYFMYFTLVVTFIFMLYKTIALVMNLLTGNGTMNFISHFLITVFINASIFAYCLYELREDRKINA